MNDEQQQSRFDGWAIVEVFGHQRFAGHVTTEAYGQAVMWRVDVPEIPAEDRTLEHAEWIGSQTVPAGTIVRDEAVQGYSKLFGAGAIYCVTPTTEQAAMKAVRAMVARPLKLVKLPDGYEAPKAVTGIGRCPECGADTELGEEHRDGCSEA